MRVLALALVLVATPAEAASVLDWAHCRLYPSHARCQPPAPAAAPAQPPPAAPVIAPSLPPIAAPAPAVAPPRTAQKLVPAKAKRPAKPKFKPAPVRKRIAARTVASWCAQVPKGTSMGQIEFFASMKGVKMTATHRKQAATCLASK